MRRLKQRGFTLVELMIVVAIIGVLAALAIYGVERYLANSKAAEAKQHVGAISRGAQGAFERAFGQSDVVVEGDQSSIEEHTLCGGAPAVPAIPPPGKKYQPITADGSDFNTGSSIGGWKCLRFAISSPIYFQYAYNRNNVPVQIAPTNPSACAGSPCYEAAAQSDLNGDGIQFGAVVRTGKINPATGALKAASHLYVLQEAQ
jgi:type IV pilus assembly protein PilA